MKLGGYILASLIETPGKTSAVIFTAGCNLKCGYCHAPDLLNTNIDKDIETRIHSDIEKNINWIDHIVITGGEPTLQEDLPRFIKNFRKYNKPIKIHTNGTGPFMLNTLIEDNLIDTISLDYKTTLDQDRYSDIAIQNIHITDIKKSFSIVQNSSIDREYRTTLCPAYISLPILIKMAKTLDDTYPWILQQYRPKNILDIERAGHKVFTTKEITPTVKELKEIYPNIRLYGKFGD